MRASTPELDALLASGQFVKCHLYTFTLISGLVYHWTDADVDVEAHGQVFSSTGPSITGARWAVVRGLQEDSADLTVYVKETDLIAGVAWPIAVRSGALDGAKMLIEKAFLPAWGEPAQTLHMFEGEVQGPECVDLEVTLPVKSDAALLNTPVPRQIFQAGCMRTLYDAGCTVDASAYTFPGAVVAAPNRYAFDTSVAKPDAYFTLGSIIFTSGLNSGVRRAVKAYANLNGRIELSYPLVYDLALGDTFIVRAGCDKTLGANGCAKFDNVINFKGMPYIPRPEAIL